MDSLLILQAGNGAGQIVSLLR